MGTADTTMATTETCPETPRQVPWVLGGAFILLFLVRDFLSTENGVIAHSAYWGRDFINVWTGGTLIRSGLVGSLYDVHAYIAQQQAMFGQLDPHLYSYPPVTFPIATLFALLPYPVAYLAWTAATCLLFVHAAKPWWPKEAGPAWLAVLTPAALVNLWAGQYGILIGSLFLLAWRNLDEEPRKAGIFFGLMLIKPHLAVLAPLVLLIRRQWTAFTWAAGTVILLVAATVALYGVEPWRQYLFHSSSVHLALLNDAGLAGSMSASAVTAVFRLGGTAPLAYAAYVLFAVPALVMIVKAAASRAGTQDLAFLAATATFLIVPYCFNYDLTVVMIGALWLLTRGDLEPVEARLANYGFLAPQLGMVLSFFFVPVMPIMLLGLCYTQYRLIMRSGTPVRSQLPAAA